MADTFLDQNSQKQENLLNLALDSTPEERLGSDILNVGYEADTGRWEVIVRYHGDLGRIANEEIEVEILLAGYAIVTLPQEYLAALADLEEVEYIEKPKSLTYGLFLAKENSCIRGQPQRLGSLRGKGVLLAIIDSGIDYLLPDFQWMGESRILWLWDQSLGPDPAGGFFPPSGFRVGREYNRQQINAAIRAAQGFGINLGSEGRKRAETIVPSRDDSGHGTGVAAVAASSNPDPLLEGVAFGCELIVVKLASSKENGFPGTTQLMRGITYALQKSLELNRPLVLNLSYGNSYGSHDGSSLLERFLDVAAGVGRNVICVGCGNEGSSGGHLEGNIRDRQRVEMAVAEQEKTIHVQLWKSYEDRFDITLVAPDNSRYTVLTEEEPGKQEILMGSTRVLIYVGMPTPYSSLQELFFVFLPSNEYVDSGIWSWEMDGVRVVSGSYQMYLPTALQRNAGTRFFQASSGLTQTIPSTAGSVISVAAYDDRNETYASFSGRGRENRGLTYLDSEGGKPDLAAPGVGILAARAGGGTESYTGTSFSTPLVAGSAALLMEWGIVQGNDPYLYGEKVKAFLRKGAKPIRGEEIYPNNRVGWGALCVADSIPRE